MARAQQPITPADTLAPIRRRQPGRFWSRAILFAAVIVLVNAVFGERGFVETLRARHSFDAAATDLARIRQRNAQLRDEARRLRDDPSTIEAVARGELGLIRPGEILVTVKDLTK